ncbi:MAG: hypothetical protein M3O22_02965 [Pseudomonadota bacterium]|nr:hypothetical protein [Pseudomonadota bacterium]
MRKIWTTALFILPLVSACQGPQYSYWKRTGSAPRTVADAGPAAQSRLKSDFAECATFTQVNTMNPADYRFPESSRNAREQQTAARTSDWQLMDGCMQTKGWTYVTTGHAPPLPPSPYLDPFRGLPPDPAAFPSRSMDMPPEPPMTEGAPAMPPEDPATIPAPDAPAPSVPSYNPYSYSEPIEIQ